MKSLPAKFQLVRILSYQISLSLSLYYLSHSQHRNILFLNVDHQITEDYDGALSVLTEMAYLAQERGGK